MDKHARHIKYIHPSGRSVPDWCRRNNYSLTTAYKLLRHGMNWPDIEINLKLICHKARKNYYNIADFVRELQIKYNINYRTFSNHPQYSVIREEFFSNTWFTDLIKERTWDQLSFDSYNLPPLKKKEERWKIIADSNGRYEVSDKGNFRHHLKGKSPEYSNLNPFRKGLKNEAGKITRYILLIKYLGSNGKYITTRASRVVATHWVVKIDKDTTQCVLFKDRDRTNLSADNLMWVTARKCGRVYGVHNSKNTPIIQYDDEGKIIGQYRSARRAALDNGLSYQCVLDICKGNTYRSAYQNNFRFKQSVSTPQEEGGIK